jgi:putative hemolysin
LAYQDGMTTLLADVPAGTRRYSFLVTEEPDLVLAAQRLRYRVFAEELGAVLRSGMTGVDIDEFDSRCDHLIIREDTSGEIVGTYRMLPPGRIDRMYSDGEFDLASLAALRSFIVETGRSCVHPDHRTGAVINMMWAGIARYLHLRGLRWLAGCASVPVADVPGGWRDVQRHLAPPRLRVTPRRPCVIDPSSLDSAAPGKVPPLLKGYLRLGAWVCGPPALDTDFGVGDFFVLLSLDRVDPRYLRHFLGQP